MVALVNFSQNLAHTLGEYIQVAFWALLPNPDQMILRLITHAPAAACAVDAHGVWRDTAHNLPEPLTFWRPLDKGFLFFLGPVQLVVGLGLTCHGLMRTAL